MCAHRPKPTLSSHRLSFSSFPFVPFRHFELFLGPGRVLLDPIIGVELSHLMKFIKRLHLRFTRFARVFNHAELFDGRLLHYQIRHET